MAFDAVDAVQMARILELIAVDARARYVVFFPFDQFWESIDMADALHPQTFLAYRMDKNCRSGTVHRCVCV